MMRPLRTPLSRRHALVLLGAAPLAGLAAPAGADALPEVTVHRDPNCGCCGSWVEHLKAAGFPARVIAERDMGPVKKRLRVPAELGSCHTAEVQGFAIEGHVPAAAIKRLLSERPQAAGLAVPGMPIGSPGMEVEGREPDTYEVVLFGPHGRRVFARYKGDRELRLGS